MYHPRYVKTFHLNYKEKINDEINLENMVTIDLNDEPNDQNIIQLESAVNLREENILQQNKNLFTGINDLKLNQQESLDNVDLNIDVVNNNIDSSSRDSHSTKKCYKNLPKILAWILLIIIIIIIIMIIIGLGIILTK